MADGLKTEKATSKKRRDERKKGNVFLSNDVVSVAALPASFFVLKLTATPMVEQIYRFLQCAMGLVVGAVYTGLQDNLSGLVLEMPKAFLFVVGPLLATTAMVTVAATFFQTKLLVSGEALKPKFNRINPLQGIKRLFSLRSVIEALKGILRITVLLFLIYRFLAGIVDTFTKHLHTDLAVARAHLVDEGFQVAMQIAIAFVMLAGAGVFYQWWDYERQLRMSEQEIKREYKQVEGDPQVKGKIKEAQRRMAQFRMMQQVPKADVVIRNPTHSTVALRYRPETDGAPIVLVKGQDELAGRIVRKAEERHIAIIENILLARALYATAELNREIPSELYNAVAEALVYLYHMDEKLKQRRESRSLGELRDGY